MILGPIVVAAACIVVEGERILVSDLASAVPAFRSAPAGESLGLTPGPGARRLVGPVELGRLAARDGVAWNGSAGVCFERASEVLTEARVLESLRSALKNEPGTWKLADFSRYPAPRGTLEFFAPPRTYSAAPVQVRGRIRYGDNRSFPVWARFEHRATGAGCGTRRPGGRRGFEWLGLVEAGWPRGIRRKPGRNESSSGILRRRSASRRGWLERGR